MRRRPRTTVFRDETANPGLAPNSQRVRADPIARRSGRRVLRSQMMGCYGKEWEATAPRMPRALLSQCSQREAESARVTCEVVMGCAAGADRWPNFLVGASCVTKCSHPPDLLHHLFHLAEKESQQQKVCDRAERVVDAPVCPARALCVRFCCVPARLP